TGAAARNSGTRPAGRQKARRRAAGARKRKKPPGGGFFLDLGGAREDRTPDLVIANDALSQLSYGPMGRRILHAAGGARQFPRVLFQQRGEDRLELRAPPRAEGGPVAVVHQRLQPAPRREHAVGQPERGAVRGHRLLQPAQRALVAVVAARGRRLGLILERRAQRAPDLGQQLARGLGVAVEEGLERIAVGRV